MTERFHQLNGTFEPEKFVLCSNPDCLVTMWDMLRIEVCPGCYQPPTHKVVFLEWVIEPSEGG
jgi:hypothetical protein